jgi:hypothetical protein
MSQLGPIEIWRVLEDQRGEDDIVEAAEQDAASMSDEQLDEALRLAGFQVADVERAARSARPVAVLGAGAPAQAVPQYVVAPMFDRPRRRAPVLWLAAAATTVTVGAGVLYATLRPSPEPAPQPAITPTPATPSTPAPSPDLVAAADLRARASDALAMGYAARCLDMLDEAKAIDPAGDTAPAIIDLRRKATTTPEPKAPPTPLKPRLK